MHMRLVVWIALVSLNLAALAAFGIDKRRARDGRRRLRESALLALAAFGGIGGAYLGRWYFRHKTRKLGFSLALHAILLVQFALLGWLFAPA
jgi:uncharacterized membrane protein YsdA (DUF1294 family)